MRFLNFGICLVLFSVQRGRARYRCYSPHSRKCFSVKFYLRARGHLWRHILYRPLGCPATSTKTSRIHSSISREHWAGALMEVRSLLVMNSMVKKNARGTDRPTDQPTSDWQNLDIPYFNNFCVGVTDRRTNGTTIFPQSSYCDMHFERLSNFSLIKLSGKSVERADRHAQSIAVLRSKLWE